MISLPISPHMQTIVSQDVSLFAGTIRSNLDPFMEHSDEECWEVLERCHLASVLRHSSGQSGTATPAVTLDTAISQSGSLSAGERQLVALARAILRRSNVIIMDEATSQIDASLDDHVRATCFYNIGTYTHSFSDPTHNP